MERINQAAAYIEQYLGRADIGIILGSGLGGYISEIQDARTLDYSDIPGFPVSTVAGHAGKLHLGTLFNKKVLLMQGRFHAYEGYPIEDVTLPIRVMAKLGIKSLIVTNAAGGVNEAFKPGDLMLIDDFINFAGRNPLFGPNLDEFGPRFPDMTYSFDRELLKLAQEKAQACGLKVQKGVYCWFMGPNYETPAEIRAARVLGADAVGMSTVPEVLVARHCGIRVLGISCITNMAAGILDQPLNHQEVVETGKRVQNDFQKYVSAILKDM